MPYVYSTLATDMVYAQYAHHPGNDLPTQEGGIKIAGKVGIADKNFVTPLGVVTSVTAEELALLEQNDVFKLHKKNGFIKVEEKAYAPEKVAAEMTGRDKSAPLTPGDYADGKTPKVGDAEGKASKKK